MSLGSAGVSVKDKWHSKHTLHILSFVYTSPDMSNHWGENSHLMSGLEKKDKFYTHTHPDILQEDPPSSLVLHFH